MGTEGQPVKAPSHNPSGALHTLYLEGLIRLDALLAGHRALRPASDWRLWAQRVLLIIGGALTLSGVIYFFAYNWSAMSRYQKFGLIEGAMVVCLAFAWIKGLDRLSGKMLLLAASTLTGALLAVFGQVYQTGADAYELFASWAALIVGWVILSNFSGLRFIWLILANIALILYWQQVGEPARHLRYEWLCLALFMLNGAALVFRENALPGRLHSGDSWLRGALFFMGLTPLIVPALHLIFDASSSNALTIVLAMLWGGGVSAGYRWYRYNAPDMTPMGLIATHGCVVILSAAGKTAFTLFERQGDMPMLLFFLMAFIAIVVITLAIVWLRRVEAVMRISGSEDAHE